MQQNNDAPVSVRLTRAQRRILEQAAAQRGLNHSDYLRQIIEEAGAAAAEGGDAPDPLGAAQIQDIVRSEVEGALNRGSADLANRVAVAVQRNSSSAETRLNELLDRETVSLDFRSILFIGLTALLIEVLGNFGLEFLSALIRNLQPSVG